MTVELTRDHLAALATAAARNAAAADTVHAWGVRLAAVLEGGGRLLACGNGGSAAEAQHLTGELVGRFRHDRRPYAGIALHADTSAGTAILNDSGPDELYARQVLAHGRPGDILAAFSTSGSSPNVVAAAETAAAAGLTVWAFTGRERSLLASCSTDALCVDAAETATVQEVHLVAVHLLCSYFDVAVGCSEAR